MVEEKTAVSFSDEKRSHQARLKMMVMFVALIASAHASDGFVPVRGVSGPAGYGEGDRSREAPRVSDSGTCGVDCFWSFDESSGTLEFTGSGEMNDYVGSYYSPATTPWSHLKESVTSLNISGPSYIGIYTFVGFLHLTTVTISDSVRVIAKDAFMGSERIDYNKVNGLLYLGNDDNPFHALMSIDDRFTVPSAKIHKGTKVIAGNAFLECNSLKDVTIPDSVVTIGNSAFENCYNLTSVVIPDSVEYFGLDVFNGCDKLNYSRDDGALYLGNEKNPYLVVVKTEEKDISTCVINSKTKIVASAAFSSCHSLTSVTIPDSVITIGVSAFASCESLTTISIPDSVRSIEVAAFSNSPLKNITIPDSVRFIGNSAFAKTKLETLKLPESIDYISEKLFSQCTDLKSVIIPDNVKIIGSDAFKQCSSLTKVFYLGTQDVTTSDAFSGCTALAPICVPPDYEPSQFCGMQATHDFDLCHNFQDLFNHCYEGVFVEETIEGRKRKNATEWENRKNECAEFMCDNKSGPVSWSRCNKTSEASMMCLNEKCVEEETIRLPFIVEVEVEPGTKVGDIDTEELRELLIEECNIEPDAIQVGWEADEDGYVIRVLIFVEDEETAEAVRAAIARGIWPKSKKAKVLVSPEFLSQASSTVSSFILLFFLIMVMF